MNYLKNKGGTLLKPVVDERDGSRAGYTLEHWDDHVDAKALAKSAQLLVPEAGLLWPDGRLIVPASSEVARYAQQRDREAAGMPPVIAGGAFSASGLYVANFIDILDATQLAIDTSLTTHKWAMYTNTLTPNFSTDSVYSATNEVSGTGYVAGGQTIVSPTTTESPAGTLMYDMADQVWAAPTSVTARGAILYADALSDKLIVAVTFGSDFTSTAGTFTIQFAATGVFTIDLTP